MYRYRQIDRQIDIIVCININIFIYIKKQTTVRVCMLFKMNSGVKVGHQLKKFSSC